MIDGDNERSVTIKLGCVVAYSFWITTVVLLGSGTWLSNLAAQNWGLAFSAAAATATIRQYFVAQNRLLRSAFEYGREQGRAEVTELRR